MKWRNTLTEAISVRRIQENGLPKYIWFIMKLEEQKRTDLGTPVRTCTTGKSLLKTESKSQCLAERVWGMFLLTSYLTYFIIFPAHPFPLPLTCKISSHLKEPLLQAYWRSHRKHLWQAQPACRVYESVGTKHHLPAVEEHVLLCWKQNKIRR